MGQTLQKAAEWTSAREGAGGKLEYTPANENILNKIIQFTEGFQGTNPEEAEIQFKSPLTWNSELNASHFSGGDYLVKDGDVESQKKGSDGATSLLVMRNKGQEKYEASVSSFEYLAKFLAACEGEKKVAETRLCLEANKDPIVQMLGDRFANTEGPDNSTYRYMEEILRAGGGGQQEEEGSGESKEKQQKMQNLRLLMLVRDFDQALLKEAVQTLSTEYRINPGEANRQLDLLRKYIGKSDTKHLLRSIAFTQGYDFQFNNGCYALPERQMNGDIYYIDVTPHDGETFCVTASTYGFFTNRGYSKEEKKLDFEREGEYYRDLMTLLREKSAKFNELVDKLVNFELHDTKEGQDSQSLNMDDDRRSQDGRTAKSRDQQRKGDDRKTADRKKKEGGEKKKKLEPSLKWKKLEVEKDDDEDEELKEKKRKQRAAERRKKRESQRIITSDGEESFEESSSESEEEEEAPERRQEANADLPSEYWQIQKLVKYLKGGNQTATIIALCAMRDFNLTQETCQLAIRDVGGLEVLINLLDTEEIKCKIGSLKILKEISGNTQIRRAIADLGGLETMVKILRDPNKDLKCLAAETIANVAKFRRARRTVRQHGGIKKLVGLLDNVSMTNVSTPEQQMDVEVARCGALALWSCSKSTRNKKAMRQAGAIPLLAKLLKSPHENMLIPVVGTLQECATESSYRLAIRTEGMIEDLVSNLKSENYELQMHCASAIFKCAEEKETRDLVRQYGGLDPLVSLLNNRDNKELLAAATGAIWKCSISKENVERFQELKAIDLLVGLLHDQPEEVLVNVVGALAELANDPPNRLTIRKAGGIPPLVTLLTGTNRALLVNDTKAVGQCAEEKDNMVVIDQLDGVRLIWSLLKNPDPEVQANAAWAICPCIENAKDAGEMVRSFVGGLELIVSLLKSNDKEVLASVCAAIANIANDEENLAVITDHGVVALLAKLTNTTEDKLRRHLAEAIARCCNWGNNRVAFGDAGAVAPLVKYLQSSELDVHTSTARALHQLSKDPTNCITMHEAGVVQLLMDMVGAADTTLQEAAAGCIANIRRLALTNEKNRTKPAQQQIQQ